MMKYDFNGKIFGLANLSIVCETVDTEQDNHGIRYTDSVTITNDSGAVMRGVYHHGATWDMDASNGDFLTETGWNEKAQVEKASSMLSSIASDATSGGCDFPDFYETFGCVNVREAWETWNACQRVNRDFKSVFGVEIEKATAFLDAVQAFDNGDTDAIEGVSVTD